MAYPDRALPSWWNDGFPNGQHSKKQRSHPSTSHSCFYAYSAAGVAVNGIRSLCRQGMWPLITSCRTKQIQILRKLLTKAYRRTYNLLRARNFLRIHSRSMATRSAPFMCFSLNFALGRCQDVSLTPYPVKDIALSRMRCLAIYGG